MYFPVNLLSPMLFRLTMGDFVGENFKTSKVFLKNGCLSLFKNLTSFCSASGVLCASTNVRRLALHSFAVIFLVPSVVLIFFGLFIYPEFRIEGVTCLWRRFFGFFLLIRKKGFSRRYGFSGRLGSFLYEEYLGGES